VNYKSIYEARFAARYGARTSERTGRAWKRMANIISAIELLGGSAAFGAYLSKDSQLAAYVALVLALCVVLNHTLHPGDKAKDEELLSVQFMKLAGDQDISLKRLNKRLTALCAVPAHGFESIRQAAYNDIAIEYGRSDHVSELSVWQRFMSVLF